MDRSRISWLTTALELVVAPLSVVLSACDPPGPEGQDPVRQVQEVEQGSPPAKPEILQVQEARFVDREPPRHVAMPNVSGPLLLNRDEIDRIVEREYPEELRGEGICTAIDIRLYIDEQGEVKEWSIQRSSGHEALDRFMARLVESFQIRPAMVEEKRIAVWSWYSLGFCYVWTPEGEFPRSVPSSWISPHSRTPREEGTVVLKEPVSVLYREPPGDPVADPPPLPPIVPRRGPVFTPYEVSPRLTNPEHIRATVARRYPRDLREQGIGGTVMLWLLVDETGTVQAAMIREGSGNEKLDRIAVLLAAEHRFTPAKHQGQNVPVWILQPVRFEAW